MKKVKILLLLSAFFTVSVQAQGFKGMLKKAKSTITKGGLSQEDAGNGLKQALDLGVDEAVGFLSAEDGYYKSPYKILLPKEAQAITKKLKVVPGFQDVEANLVEKVNRAAEDAATKAKPIFVSAIKQMSFKDAMNILMGNKDSATRYLEKATYDQLYTAFKPVIIESLEKVNASSYWNSAVTQYNKIPFAKKTNPDLEDHVTRQALSGMFGLVEKKEEGIRGDKSLRTNDLLQKVFAQQDQ